MRAAAFFSVLVAPSTALSLFKSASSQQAIGLDDHRKIPGESPLELCADKETNGYIDITSVDLSPNPPVPGKELTITAKGEVHKTIEEGAYIDLTVKYGYVKLLTTKADLCEQMSEVDISCPLEPGERKIEKTVELPKEIPPGTYNVVADVFAANGERITCLTATITFDIPKLEFLGAEL